MHEYHDLFPSNQPHLTITDKLQIAVQRINAAIDKFKPVAVFGLLSGGNDSLPATLAASMAKQFDGAVHVNTGFGIEATRDFVRATCEARRWPLLEYKAMENVNADGTPDPQDYEAIVLEHGFPGPFGHGVMYVRLKDRQLQRVERDNGATSRYCIPKDVRDFWRDKFKKRKGWRTEMRRRLNESGEIERYFSGKRIMYVTGVRSQESQRRMGSVEPVKIDGRRIWVAALHDWSKLDCAAARMHAGLQQNPVCELIGMSGECLCGAFAKPGELEILRGWPLTHPMYLRIVELQKKAEAAGVPCKWGERPPKLKKVDGFPDLFSSIEMPLCHNCVKHEGGKD